MYKISISGKANSGKNTLAQLISDRIKFELESQGDLMSCYDWSNKIEYMAFADPIKEMARNMFPFLTIRQLYGDSELRSNIIPNAFKDGNPLTIRQLLIDLGTGLGRTYNDNIWLENFEFRFKKAQEDKLKLVIVSDTRFRNEFDLLKKLGFYHIRLIRNSCSQINDISEIEQDSISNNEFNIVVENNGTLDDLKYKVIDIVNGMKTLKL